MLSSLTAGRCSCGAITVSGDGWSNSMRPAVFRKEFPGVVVDRSVTWANCNHCVNHYGIDLCGCGSGKKVGKCNGGFNDCVAGLASQVKATAMPSMIDVISNRGGFV